MRKAKGIFLFVLRIGTGIILLVLLFKVNKLSLAQLAAGIKSADKLILTAAFFAFSLTYILSFLRWILLLKAAKIHIPLKRAATSYAGGVCSSLILPSSIGGDLMRSIDLSRYTNRSKEVVATVLLDRLSGYLGLTLLLLSALLFGGNYILGVKIVYFAAFLIIGLLVVVLLVLFNRFVYSRVNRLLQSTSAGRIREYITELHHELHIFRNQRGALFNSLLLSLIVQSVGCACSYLVALSLGIRLNPLLFFVFVPIIGAVTLLPVSIGGAGVREWMTLLLFTGAGVEGHLAAGLSLLNFSFIVLFGAIGGLVYVFTVRHRRLQRHQPSAV